MAEEKKPKQEKPAKTPEQIEAEKAAKAAKKAEVAAKAKAEGKGDAKAPEGGEAPAEGGKGKGKGGKGGGGGAKKADEGGEAAAFPQGYMPRLRKRYNEQVAGALASELKIENKMAIPRVEKVVISMGLGKAIAERPRLEAAVKELTAIAGQKAVICKAKKSVSNFKLREGMEIGAKVTLRGNRMWEFLDRLITLAIPRVKDFRGLNAKAFDGRGNYSMGLAEQTVFPEVNADTVTFHQGMNITIVTTAPDNTGAQALLRHLGMPFAVEEKSARKAG